MPENHTSLIDRRNSEKTDELLLVAFQMLEKNNVQKAMSIYCSILLHYKGSYSAIQSSLQTAKKCKLLPDNFEIPQTVEIFLKKFNI